MFTEKEKKLANETALASSLLGNGLNSLRKADIYNKGLYYQAFFSLSIGIERLLKIIIIEQYRCEHDGKFPNDINLKKLSHNLIKICDCIGIKFKKESIHFRIISFLSEFSQNSRYYNIDNMLDQNSYSSDPLDDWNFITKDIILGLNKKKKLNNKNELCNNMNSVMSINFYDLSGKEINNAELMLENLEQKDIIQSYSVQYVVEIITKLVYEIKKLENQKYLMPVLSEFFPFYHGYMKPYEIRHKKNRLNI